MREPVIGLDAPILFEVFFYKNIFGTISWENEFNDIIDSGNTSQHFVFCTFDAAKEFAVNYLRKSDEYICSNILLNVFDDENNMECTDCIPVWDCVIADAYSDSEAKAFFKNIKLDNSKN